MLKIGDFSKLSRVSIRMLRHYDEIGLLHPVRIDPETSYRYYSENQLPVAGRITALKDMGFGLSAIGEMLDSYSKKFYWSTACFRSRQSFWYNPGSSHTGYGSWTQPWNG